MAKLDPELQYQPPVTLHSQPFGLSPNFPPPPPPPGAVPWLGSSSVPPPPSRSPRPLHPQHHQQQQQQQFQFNVRNSGPPSESFARGTSARTDLGATTPTEELGNPHSNTNNYQHFSTSLSGSQYNPGTVGIGGGPVGGGGGTTLSSESWSSQTPTIYSIPLRPSPTTTTASTGFSANGAYPSPRSADWSNSHHSHPALLQQQQQQQQQQHQNLSSSLPPLSALLSENVQLGGGMIQQRRGTEGDLGIEGQRKKLRIQ